MQFYLKVGKILLKGFASILFRSEIKYRASHFLQAVFLILRNFKIFGFEGGHFYRAYILRESVSKGAGGDYLGKPRWEKWLDRENFLVNGRRDRRLGVGRGADSDCFMKPRV